MGQITEYTYYPNGLLRTVKDAKNQVTTYRYDTANHLNEIEYADGKKENFTYDQAGNLTSYTNNVVSGAIIYDNLNRKTSETVTMGGFTKTLAYTYNSTGEKATYTSPENVTYTYNYNKAGQPVSMVFGTRVIGFSYEQGLLKHTSLPNGTATDYGYNPAAWLNAITRMVKKLKRRFLLIS